MEIIRGLHNLPNLSGSVVTVGNFDGVHCGHQALLQRLTTKAKQMQLPSVVITFEPLPREFFAKESDVTPRLMRGREKYYALAEQGIDKVVVVRFTKAFANITAEEFIERLLVQHLQVKHIVVGDDFRFGKGRVGDFAYLVNAGASFGFTVEAMPSILVNGERVSSTLIRDALQRADHAAVIHYLGRPYSMKGRIVYGNQRGRQIGFPTANINLHRQATPVKGVYAVRMHGIQKEAIAGVANIGVRPTVDGTRTLLEVHLFDFSQDIYGHHVCVEFCKKLRDEEHYDNLELLKNAITNDAMLARNYFRERGEL